MEANRANVTEFEAGKVTPGSLVRYVFRLNRAEFRWIVLSMALLALVSVAAPIFNEQVFSVVIPNADRALMAQIFLMSAVFVLGTVTLQYMNAVIGARIRRNCEWHLQTALMDRILDLPYAFFREHSRGELKNRFDSLSLLVQVFSNGAVSTLLNVVILVPATVMMCVYSPDAVLWFLPVVAALAILESAAVAVAFRCEEESLEKVGKFQGDLARFIGGILKLRAACAEEVCLGRLGKTYGESRLALRRMSALNAVADAALAAVPLCLFLAMGIAAARAMGGEDAMTAADCAGFVSASGMFAAAVVGLVAVRPELVRIRPLCRRVKPLLEAETECCEADDAPTENPPPEGEVAVDGVSFSYDGAHRVLDNVTIRAKRGETVAITGASGAGKSTLVRLLLGFERPASGSVSYDGIDLLRRDPRQLRRALGVVMQNAQVMTNSIFRTIIGETPDLSLDDAWAAAEAAAVADEIRAMPMQMQTLLAEGGSVSGGQRQRIMIARALARKPRILILDEATSALDNASQRSVTETLAKLKEVTKIVIAHRLSTVRAADRIYVLDAGRVAETGTFDELMAKGGLFATLAKRQLSHVGR